LTGKGINTLILVGMQTDYCIDTTCKVAFEYGYEVIIPRGANSTVDQGLMTGQQIHDYYVDKIWDKRFAQVVEMDEMMRKLNGLLNA